MTTPYGLEGRSAIVTGASRGIGLAVAEEASRAGAGVCDGPGPGRGGPGRRRLGGVGLAGSVADPAHRGS